MRRVLAFVGLVAGFELMLWGLLDAAAQEQAWREQAMYDYDDYDLRADEADEYRQQDRWQRAYRNRLLAHPDPRDPDYPGDWDDDSDE